MSEWFIPHHRRPFLLPTPSQPTYIHNPLTKQRPKTLSRNTNSKPIRAPEDTLATTQVIQSADISQSDVFIQDIVDTIISNATEDYTHSNDISNLELSENLDETVRSLDHPDLSDSLGNPISHQGLN